MKYSILLILLFTGCILFQPTGDGRKARSEVAEVIKDVIPQPWGYIAAGAFSLVTGGVAAVKAQGERRAKKVAKAAVTAIEASGDEKVKKAAMKASKYLEVPAELDKLVTEVEKENGHAISTTV